MIQGKATYNGESGSLCNLNRRVKVQSSEKAEVKESKPPLALAYNPE